MFERFTDPARRVVALAQEEASALGHEYIGTEHLLLGLLSEREGLGGRVLTSLGLTLERARAETIGIIGTGAKGVQLDPDALATIGIDLDEVRRRIEAAFGPGAIERTRAGCGKAPGGRRPFTPRSKKVLELALREALSLRHGYVGTEHILLGLLREGEGVAIAILERQGLASRAVREAVLGELAA